MKPEHEVLLQAAVQAIKQILEEDPSDQAGQLVLECLAQTRLIEIVPDTVQGIGQWLAIIRAMHEYGPDVTPLRENYESSTGSPYITYTIGGNYSSGGRNLSAT